MDLTEGVFLEKAAVIIRPVYQELANLLIVQGQLSEAESLLKILDTAIQLPVTSP